MIYKYNSIGAAASSGAATFGDDMNNEMVTISASQDRHLYLKAFPKDGLMWISIGIPGGGASAMFDKAAIEKMIAVLQAATS